MSLQSTSDKQREIPHLLQEVGRLREVTFRRVGEGTGKSRDLDSFDDYYSHIFLWHKTKRELVGAYRAGHTCEIIAKRGIAGLYTSTLFRYDEQLFQKIGPGARTGSFVCAPRISTAVCTAASVVEGNCAPRRASIRRRPCCLAP